MPFMSGPRTREAGKLRLAPAGAGKTDQVAMVGPVSTAPHRFRIQDGRAAAWSVLEDFANGRCERLGEALDALRLPEREAGLARELALGVARHQRLYDAVADPFLRPGEQPLPLRLALRLAAHQLFALDRIPPHAAGDTAIELLRQRGHDRLTGVANAVIRRLGGMRLAERRAAGPLGRLPEERLPRDPAVLHSLPEALVADVRAVIAGDEERRLAALNVVPHLCTRSLPGAPRPNGAGILRQEGAWTWWADPQEALRGPVAAGQAVVQDRAQGRLIELSGALPGEWVLDVCAAPGGKAMAFAERGCRVVACDAGAAKMPRLRANLGVGARVLVADGRRPALAAGFDVVVVDAPCSNSGVLGRRPEARWRYQPRPLLDLGRLQAELLARSAALVKPGGKLIYATCSVSPRENQGVSHRLDGWRVLAEEAGWPDDWQGGAYAAVLVRSR
jgi:16S rRNA (cytosine967-C5)-methyltransferase